MTSTGATVQLQILDHDVDRLSPMPAGAERSGLSGDVVAIYAGRTCVLLDERTLRRALAVIEAGRAASEPLDGGGL